MGWEWVDVGSSFVKIANLDGTEALRVITDPLEVLKIFLYSRIRYKRDSRVRFMLCKNILIVSISFIILFIFLTSTFDLSYSIDHQIKNNELIIAQVQKNHSIAKKPRIVVSRFENKAANGSSEIGEGMAEMLANALFANKKFIVLDLKQ